MSAEFRSYERTKNYDAAIDQVANGRVAEAEAMSFLLGDLFALPHGVELGLGRRQPKAGETIAGSGEADQDFEKGDLAANGDVLAKMVGGLGALDDAPFGTEGRGGRTLLGKRRRHKVLEKRGGVVVVGEEV